MRVLLVIAAIFISTFSFANMASPYRPGTVVSNPFTSKNVDILHENIRIKISKDFITAHFGIEYTINTETAGEQIPLLFYAMGLAENFKVFLDGKEIIVRELRQRMFEDADSGMAKFATAYRMPKENDGVLMKVSWDKNFSEFYRLSDLRYFETNLAKGEHKINIEYDAHPWSDRSEWIKKTGFSYSLAPAKYWRSFGSLDIVIDATDVKEELITNLGGKIASGNITTFKFITLPADEFVISRTPKISDTAKFLLELGPHNLSIIFASFLFLLNLFFLFNYRKKNQAKKRNPFVLFGSIVSVILIYIFFLNSFSMIDNALGKEASKYHGYVFLEIIYYPVIFLVFLFIFWMADKFFKRKNMQPAASL